jgi:hypothetical protein
MGGYPADIKERALAIAKIIREIPDETERRQTARTVCLQAVTGNPLFPEVLFLRDCGIRLDLRQGPAWKVKKTRHFIRTCEEGQKLPSYRGKALIRRQTRRLTGETEQPVYVPEARVTCRKPVRAEKSAVQALYQMW